MRATATTGTTTATATLAVPLRPPLLPPPDLTAPPVDDGEGLGELTASPVPELRLLVGEIGAAVLVDLTVVVGGSLLGVTVVTEGGTEICVGVVVGVVEGAGGGVAEDAGGAWVVGCAVDGAGSGEFVEGLGEGAGAGSDVRGSGEIHNQP